MKKDMNFQALIFLILAALAFEVIVLSKQNRDLKHRLMGGGLPQGQEETIQTKIGQPAPDLPILMLNNEKRNLSFASSKKKSLLYFFSTSCPQCKNNIPAWRRLTDKLAGKPVNVYGILKDDLAAAREYAYGYGLNFPVGVNQLSDSTFTREYGIHFVPTTVVIGADGKFLSAEVGVLNEETLNKILDLLTK
jgi:peroxiredoxin